MAVNLSTFRTSVLMYASGAPIFLVDEKVREAARRFCKDTWIWQDPQDSELELTVDPDEEDVAYALTASEGSEIIAVSDVIVNDDPMDTEDYSLDIQSARLIIGSPFNADDEVLVKRVYRPTRTVATLPDFLLSDYEQPISKLAASILLMMPRQPWSEPALAVRLENEYLNGVQEAISSALKCRTSKSLKVRGRDFLNS